MSDVRFIFYICYLYEVIYIESDCIQRCPKNASRFFTIHGCTPVEVGCLRNVCIPHLILCFTVQILTTVGGCSDTTSPTFHAVSSCFFLCYLFFSFIDAKQVLLRMYSRQKIFFYEIKYCVKTELFVSYCREYFCHFNKIYTKLTYIKSLFCHVKY